MSLFKSITDFQKYVKVNSTLKNEFETTILPFEFDATQKFLLPHLDAKIISVLDNYYNEIEADHEEEDAKLLLLLPYVQRALARFTMFMASPSLDINLGSTGYTTATNATNVPASKARVEKLDASLEQLGWDSIEAMLAFLEENKDYYPSWKNSDAYTMHISNLVNSATEFDKYHKINKSRLAFIKYRPEISKVESLKIIPVISQDLYDQLLVEIKADELTPANKSLLKLLQTAIVNFVVSQSDDDKFYVDATAFVAEAKKLLDANLTDYALYADSDSYRGEDATYEHFENEEDNTIFVAGAPL